jgi:NAD(P)-dependent dehydrogenase (short-subunit alcohol dehydrogenase family)
MDEVNRRWGGADALINNAGIAYRTVVEHWDEAAWNDIMEVDVRAALELTRLALPAMRARRAGRILNISSVGGMMAMPTMSLYSAAKFALEGATEALWYEVRPWGIRVSLIEPGFIRSDSFRGTRFTQRSFRGAMDEGDPYHSHYLCMADFIERMMERAPSTPEDVARCVLRTLERKHPPLRVYATPDAHLFAWMRRLLPRGLYHEILYRALPHVRTWGRPGSGEPR